MNSKALKDMIKSMAQENSLDPQAIMQNYFLERFLERLSISIYKENVVLKGGLLIASMIGVYKRTTMDMDATVQGYTVSEDEIKHMVDEIASIKVDDGVSFKIQSIKEIRHDDEYNGYRAVVISQFEKIKQHIQIDISTGDVLTPSEIEYEYKPLFEGNRIKIRAYNIETILAEKIETVLRRGEDNTRMRDFYDIHMLRLLRYEEISVQTLKMAIHNTSRRRQTTYILDLKDELLQTIKESDNLKSHWLRYQNNYSYASDITFLETTESLDWLLKVIM